MHWPRHSQSKSSIPLSPLSFHSSRPPTGHFQFLSPHLGLERSLTPSLSGPHIAILLLYIDGMEYCTQSLFTHSRCTIRDKYSDIVLQATVHSRASKTMFHSKFFINIELLSLKEHKIKLQRGRGKSLLPCLNMQKEAPYWMSPSFLYIRPAVSSTVSALIFIYRWVTIGLYILTDVLWLQEGRNGKGGAFLNIYDPRIWSQASQQHSWPLFPIRCSRVSKLPPSLSHHTLLKYH